MADFNSKYTGERVEELLDQIANGDIGGGIETESDPIFSASPAASITEAKKAEWDNKVDKVSGKQLSTEDFTTALKTKLEGLSNYDDTELSNALSTLRGDFDKLVSGDTTTAIKTFNEIIAFLDGIQDTQDLSSIIASIEQQIAAKQDEITDLDTIREGASKGATALQSIPEEYVTDDQLMWIKAEGESGVRLKGTNGTATGNLAISAGDDKTASDGTPFASVASGDHAVVFGFGNTCAGRSTLAQGLYNTVNGKDSVAFGQRNIVGGDQAFAVGQQNEVTARLGVAIGYKNKATNTDSIAIGYQNTSSGSASVAMGDTCEANGTSSTAMGYKTKAAGAYSSTFGQNTQATNSGEVAMGLYNKSTTSTDAAEQTMFSFGLGTSDTNRANALEIKKNGDVYIGDKLLSSEGEVGPQGPQGEQGPKGEDGVGIASVKQTTTSSADGGTNVVTVTLSNGTTSTFSVKNGSKGSNGTNGTNGKDGADGEDGATFTPSVDSAGNLSWSNNKGLTNPPTVNIKGPKGDQGDTGSGGGGSSSGSVKEYIVVEPDLSPAGSEAYISDIVPNKTYIVSEPVSLLSINEFSVSDALSDEYNVIFKADYGGTTLTINSYNSIYWANGVIPTIEAAAVYELSIQRVNIAGGNFFNAVLTNFKIIE